MASPQIEITVANASEELGKSNALLQKYKRKNSAQKNKMGPGYKTGLEERIATSQRLIAQSTMTANATTLSGSPNDPIPPGPGILPAGHLNGLSQGPGNSGPGTGNKRSGAPQSEVAEDPLEVITDSIPAKMVSRFAFKWQGEEQAIESADPGSTAEEFADLCDAATDLIDHVTEFAENSGFSPHQFNWKIDYNGGRINVSHLISLHTWLVTNSLMMPSNEQKPAPPKVKKNVPIKIVDNDCSKVASMEAVRVVLMNRSGREKCITCDQGARGKALVSKPVPPAEDHPYLADCKCPLRGAALELWMIKMTTDIEGIPQRGDAQVANHRLALNPDILKVIASAIELTSGHDTETLLQPKMDRKLKETMKAFINEDNGEDMDEENDEDEG
ncbi:hypothetical protein B0H13DRAFT_2329842 [Mycena leptocephala]|nr:hypothetical protein B0H13DRAFT_2329842 [Mycena leptocephala]